MKFLKKIILILAVGASVTSCSKDDEIKNVSGNKYETTYAKITVSYEGVEQSIEYDTAAELKEEDIYLKVQFKSDDTFWVYEMVDYENETYDWIQVGTWSQNDSKVNVAFDGQTLDLTVDGSQLIMIMDLDEIYSKKLGIEEDPTGSVEWHFSKI